MDSPVVIAYDVGTSGVKAVVVDQHGRVLGSRIRTYGLDTPQPGWAEQDVEAMVAELGRASRDVLAAVGVEPSRVAAVGATAQMFNVVPVDASGRSLRPMLSWLDQRAAPEAAEIRGRHPLDGGYATYDTIVTAKDIIPRIVWLARHEPGLNARAAWYLDCKEAVVARLTGAIGIDPSGASAFRLAGATTGAWDPVRCHASGIAYDRLPPVRPATDIVGYVTPDAATMTGLQAGTPVVVGAGDVPASQLGAGACDPGDIHLSLGTAVYFGITTERHLEDPAQRLGPIAHVVSGQEILWLEIATGGAALAWLDRQLVGPGAAESRKDHAAIDRDVPAVAGEMEGLLFAPWLTGERVPVFDDDVRAAFLGLALHHGPAHLTRAVMEGVACQIAWAFEYGLAYGIEPRSIRAVGGGSIGTAWTEIIAETLGRPLEIVAEPQDAAARGAAACALVGIGLAPDLRRAVPARVERSVRPDPVRVARANARLERFRELHAALRTVA